MTIVSNPERVCLQHGLEFWTGLLVYARDRRGDPCMKNEGVCTCVSCQELGASYPRAVAIEPTGPSLRHDERFSIRIAS
jgi:hypothetical protein